MQSSDKKRKFPRRALIWLLLAIVLSSALIISVFAYSVPDDTIVYVTPSGEKYHREDCSYITSSTTKSMTIEQAVSKGYTACSRCDADELTSSSSSSKSKVDEWTERLNRGTSQPAPPTSGSSSNATSEKGGLNQNVENFFITTGIMFIVSFAASLVRCLCICRHKGKLSPDNPLFGNFSAILYGLLFFFSFPVSILRYWVRNYYIKFAVDQALLEQREKNLYLANIGEKAAFQAGHDAGFKEAKAIWKGCDENGDTSESLAALNLVSRYAARMHMSIPEYIAWCDEQERLRQQSEE